MQKRNVLLAIASGALLALAMAVPWAWPVAWVGLIPLLVALRRTTLAQAAACGLVAGLAYFGVSLFWISLFGYLPWVVLTMFEAIFFAVFAAIAARLLPNRTGWFGYVAVPAAWTAMQWTRSLGPYSLTWGSFAHAQANNLCIAQIASVTGVWGIDFLVCLVNVALADAFVPHNGRRRYAHGIVALLIAACVWMAGYASLRTPMSGKHATKVAIIQGNLDQNVVPDTGYLTLAFQSFERMSRTAAADKPALIVWPETTLPASIANTSWSDQISLLAHETKTNYVIGAYDTPANPLLPGYYNTALFYDRRGRQTGAYHKVHLVPFGEFVPLREYLPFLKRYQIRDEDIIAGADFTPIRTPIGPIGVNICFESLFSYISREETRRGAVALLVMTNDAWFERTQAARQHMLMSKLRAIENRRFVIRAAATGISTIIDPYGRTLTELGIFKRGVVAGRITPLHGLTPYVRFGDYFAYACLLIVAGALLWPRTGKTL